MPRWKSLIARELPQGRLARCGACGAMCAGCAAVEDDASPRPFRYGAKGNLGSYPACTRVTCDRSPPRGTVAPARGATAHGGFSPLLRALDGFSLRFDSAAPAIAHLRWLSASQVRQ